MDKIKDSNDLLGYMIEIQNENHVCKISKIYEKVGCDKDVKFFLAELEYKSYIEMQSTNSVYITPSGRRGYLSERKKAWNAFKPRLRAIILFILGVISTIFTQYLTKILSL